MRDYEAMLLAFGAGLGVAWAAVALFLVSLSESYPAVVSYTILLPIVATFLLGAARVPLPDLLFTCFAVGAIGGVVVASGVVVYWRMRGG